MPRTGPVVVLFLCAAFALAGCRQESTALVLTWSPPEAVISIDGFTPLDAVSPHTFKFFKEGRYRLRVEAPGYNTVEMFIDVPRGGRVEQSVHLTPSSLTPPPVPPPLTPPTVALIADSTADTEGPAPCRVAVTSDPAGARVSTGTATSGALQPVGNTPVEIAVSADRPTRLEISAGGFETLRRIIPPAAQRCPGALHLSLTPSRGGAPDPQPVPQPVPQPDPLVIPTPDPPPPVADPRETTGLLSVVTEPWSTVYVDGRSFGVSPLQAIPLAPGTHTVIMENRDLGKRRTKNVIIRPGDHVRLAEEL